MYTIENNVGRLIEARLATPFTLAEVDECVSRIRTTVLSIQLKVVFAVDLTRVEVLPPEVADKFLFMMRADNPRVERTAYLLPPQRAIVGLQIERMIRDAKNPVRRTFRDINQMATWLGEALTSREHEQLRRFLLATRA